MNECQHCAQASTCLLKQNNLPTEVIQTLFQFHSRILKKGEHLCYQGQKSDNLYIIRSGMLKSTLIKPNGEEYVMGFYLPPDLFGFEGIDEQHRSVGITALEHSNICVIPSEKMQALTQQSPALSMQLMRMVSRRIHQDNVALLRTTAHQRVATFLLQLAARHQQLGFSHNSLNLAMTHQDIANYLRMTANTISRIFHEWQEKKMIDIRKHMIYLLDVSHIALIAET
ncbi:MAG: Crp/Fnr family transcriptional regulator [Coxiellaceae bacterium]|nr:Crp/Fnr family transcriptional regulator [Coxiellaceae bacterium]